MRFALSDMFLHFLKEKENPLLYFITDSSLTGTERLLEIAGESIRSGIDMIQIREDKLSDRELFSLTRSIVELADQKNCKVLVNDRFDIALSAGAHGVHLGSRSMPVHTVRRNVGTEMIIGFSAHSLEEIIKVKRDGADFATYSPVFQTSDPLKGKPKGVKDLADAVRKSEIPVFALGGINISNFPTLSNTGVAGIAVISAIANSRASGYTVEQLKSGLSRFRKTEVKNE